MDKVDTIETDHRPLMQAYLSGNRTQRSIGRGYPSSSNIFCMCQGRKTAQQMHCHGCGHRNDARQHVLSCVAPRGCA